MNPRPAIIIVIALLLSLTQTASFGADEPGMLAAAGTADNSGVPVPTDSSDDSGVPAAADSSDNSGVPVAADSSDETDLIAFGLLDAQPDTAQIVIVKSKTAKATSALVYLYEKDADGQVYRVFSDLPARIGRKGVGKVRQNDEKTPSGVYKIDFLFGHAKLSFNKNMKYKHVTARDYWVGDTRYRAYNKWVRLKAGQKRPAWNDYERLRISTYKRAANIAYNTDPIKKGKGGAIFMHKWKNAKTATSGCIALSEKNLNKLLTSLDKKRNPRIAIGTADTLQVFTQNPHAKS
jgi:L,D-peptidoglycan transpeptidase YkuD (ErfK/YbiS/YcfS/YnhG family)